MIGSQSGYLYQGRQEHGWFGHGTAPQDAGSGDDDNELFQVRNADDRADYAVSSLIGHVPHADRSRWTAATSPEARRDVKAAFAVWYASRGLSRDAFRARFLTPYVDDATVDRLRQAAAGVVEARSYDDVAAAGEALAVAAKGEGPDRWPRFIGDAAERAHDAVADGEVPGVVKASATDQAVGALFTVLLGAFLIAGGYASRGDKPKAATDQPAGPIVPPVAPATPPKDARDPNGAKAPGKPGEAEKFRDPKSGEQWVKAPNDRGYGWLDASGDVWVPTGPGDAAHGGPHWDVQSKNGFKGSVYPGGRRR